MLLIVIKRGDRVKKIFFIIVVLFLTILLPNCGGTIGYMGVFTYDISKTKIKDYIDSLMHIYPDLYVPLDSLNLTIHYPDGHIDSSYHERFDDVRVICNGKHIQFTYAVDSYGKHGRDTNLSCMISFTHARRETNGIKDSVFIQQDDLSSEEQEKLVQCFYSEFLLKLDKAFGIKSKRWFPYD